MTKGYLIYASNSENKDYVRCSYALALSILKFMPNSLITLVSNNHIPENYKNVFDKILNVPWNSTDETLYRINDRWKLYHCSPYDETIVLDADSILTSNIAHWWDFLGDYDLFFPSEAYDYRNKIVTSRYYRRLFDANNLPNLYSTVFYFKKNDFSLNFFSWLELVNYNWELFYGKYISEFYPTNPSMDVSISLVCKILDLESHITRSNSMIKFVHMKPYLMSWENIPSSWIDSCTISLDENLNLKIASYQQNGIFHYVDYRFLTNKFIKILEGAVL